MVLTMVLMALLGPLVTPYDPYLTDSGAAAQPPSSKHPFGTDLLGRDVLTRVIFGARLSLEIVVVVLLLTNVIGLPLGALAGYCGGFVDEVIMRVADAFMAFPSFLLAMAIATVLGRGLLNAMLALALVNWAEYARLVRGTVLAVKNQLYVEAARATGASEARILWKHVLANCWGPLVVKCSMDAGMVVLAAAGLGFVGLGASPPTPEWGLMVARDRHYLLTYWWMPIFPSLAIGYTVAGWMLVGDAVRDLLDPRLRRRREVRKVISRGDDR
jgi:peptide/nickel transport system permease protein